MNNHGSSRTLEVADNIDFNLGRKHAMRVGAAVRGRGVPTTSTPATPPAPSRSAISRRINAGTPLQFTQRIGQVDTSFSQYQLGLYWQDDIRVNRNFSFSVGVRQEMQSLIDDKLNLMPRLGFTWNAPGKLVVSAAATARSTTGTTPASTTRRCASNGVSQRDLLILNPGYPDPFVGGDATDPPGRPRAGVAGPADAVHPPGVDRRRARDHARTCRSRRRTRCCAGAT